MTAPTILSLDVLLFASAADALGRPRLRLDLEPGATAGDVLAAVHAAARAGAGVPLPASCRLAVNQRFAGPDDVVRPGDEIAVIPPVAGG